MAALQSLVGVPLSADSNATSETTPLGAVLKKPDDDLERQVGYEAGAFFMVTLNVSTAASGAGMVESDFGSPLCASAGRLVAFKGVGVVAGGVYGDSAVVVRRRGGSSGVAAGSVSLVRYTRAAGSSPEHVYGIVPPSFGNEQSTVARSGRTGSQRASHGTWENVS